MGEFSDSWLLPQDSQDDPLFSLDLDPWDPILAFGESSARAGDRGCAERRKKAVKMQLSRPPGRGISQRRSRMIPALRTTSQTSPGWAKSEGG
jgi:hypothetical protein